MNTKEIQLLPLATNGKVPCPLCVFLVLLGQTHSSIPRGNPLARTAPDVQGHPDQVAAPPAPLADVSLSHCCNRLPERSQTVNDLIVKRSFHHTRHGPFSCPHAGQDVRCFDSGFWSHPKFQEIQQNLH